MKNNILLSIAENFAKLMKRKNSVISWKELSSKAHISYPTLAPILRGERDFGVTKLVALAEALNTTPDELLRGAFKEPIATDKPLNVKPKFLVSFITNVKLTRCNVYNIETQKDEVKLFPFSLFCASDIATNMMHIRAAILDMCGKNVPFDQIHVYISVLGYEHVYGRRHMLDYGLNEFGGFIMEPDWKTLHNSIFGNKNGMLITINDGYAISYSIDNSHTIEKYQGYSFPISDEAGNIWLGCEAIKHAINVKEGLEKRTLLSDKILSLVNSDIDLLATKTFENQRDTYLEISTIVKELASKENKSHELIKRAFDNIWQRIAFIDKKVGMELPISLAGDLAYLYEEFIPENRLVKTDLVNETESFDYAKKLLISKATANE